MALDNNKKGFSGLDSMLTDVDQTIDSIPEAKAPKPPEIDTNQRPTNPSSTTPPKLSGNPSSGLSTAGKWFLGGIALIIVIGVASNSGKQEPSQSRSSAADWEAASRQAREQSRPATSPTPAPASASAPAPAPAPATAPWETISSLANTEMPPVGNGLVLSQPQIRYCLVEDASLNAIKEIVNHYSSLEIDDFNARVSDYNSRCSRFKYRRGSLESIRSEIAANLSTIEATARSKWRKLHASAQPAQPTALPTHRSKTTAAARKSNRPSLPAHSHMNFNGSDWECDRGYRASNGECVRISLPAHAHLDFTGNDWDCDAGYRVSSGQCAKLAMPLHSHLDYTGNDWECDRGYRQSGSECIKLVRPLHSHLDYTGNDWECDNGYRQSGSECVKLAVPAHAHLDYTGNDWECNKGYQQSGNECLAITRR